MCSLSGWVTACGCLFYPNYEATKNKEEHSMDLKRLLIVLSALFALTLVTGCASAADKEAANFLAKAGTACVNELAESNTVQNFDPAARETLPLSCQFVIASDELAKVAAQQSELGATLVSQGLAKNEKKLMEVVPTACFVELGASGKTFDFSISARSTLPVSCQYGYGHQELESLTQHKLELELKLSEQFNAPATEVTPSVSPTATP